MRKIEEPSFNDLLIVIKAINSRFNTNYTVADIFDSVLQEYRERSPLNSPVVKRLSFFNKENFKIVLDEYSTGDIYLKAYIEDTNYLFSYLSLFNTRYDTPLKYIKYTFAQQEYILRFIQLHNIYLTYLYEEDEPNSKAQYNKDLDAILSKFLKEHSEVMLLDTIQDPDKFIERFNEFEGYNPTLLSEIMSYIQNQYRNLGSSV